MNKLYKILLILIVALASCNPMENINKQMDEQAPAPKESFSYTLASGDYSTISTAALKVATDAADSATAKSINSTNSLPEGYAATYVPAILQSAYPALGLGSNAQITYNFNNGSLASLVQYTSANQYKLSAADYNSIGGDVANYGTFSPSNPPASYVPDFLKTKFADAADGTLEFVTCNYANTDPTAAPPILDEEFNGSLGTFTAVSITGAQEWYASSYGADQFAKISGYSGGAQDNEDWLVSPAIDLSGTTYPCFQVDQAVKYLNGQWDQLQVMVSTDYSGDVTTATWTPMTITTLPAEDFKFVTSEKVDLSKFKGKSIYLAFKYVSTTSNAATWEINWVKVYGSATTTAIGTQSVFYRLQSGTWKPEPGIYALSSNDYSAMGAPGQYNNFSSSAEPDNYLPQFLAQKYPYAQLGDRMNVAYLYYSGKTYLRVDQYTFTNTGWMNYNPVEVKVNQFINNGSKWVFDPTVTFTMVSSDYQLIVDAVNTDPNLKQYVNKYGTGEVYYGADAHYNDFSAQISSRTDPAFDGLTESEATTLIMTRIQEGLAVMLQAKFPDAVAQVSGIDVKYVVTYYIYGNDGSNSKYTSTFQCTKSGPNPQFTSISGPTKD
ncbi:MAG: choice-of-anchor J domain-containing protein [Bacteroidales bacterium]|nr:choice-of-anchor J domain-containing protein [Bacteroidales bacterium]